MKTTIIAIAMITAGVLGLRAEVGDYADHRVVLRAKADLSLGDSYNIDYTFPQAGSSNYINYFGLEVGYVFWHNERHALEAGTGFFMDMMSFKTSTSGSPMSYCYDAGPEADMDGNSYIRYMDVAALNQEYSLTSCTVPLYLRYNFNLSERFAIYGKVGGEVNFGTSMTSVKKSGSVYSYGIYPEYDNLRMDDEWLNDFGQRDLDSSKVQEIEKPKANFNLLAGLGFAVRLTDNIGLAAGLNYRVGFSNVLKPGDLKSAEGKVTPQEAPVTYTVENGLECKSLLSGTTKSRLSRLGVDFGLEFFF